MRLWDETARGEVSEVKSPEMGLWDEAEEVKLPRWGLGMRLRR